MCRVLVLSPSDSNHVASSLQLTLSFFFFTSYPNTTALWLVFSSRYDRQCDLGLRVSLTPKANHFRVHCEWFQSVINRQYLLFIYLVKAYSPSVNHTGSPQGFSNSQKETGMPSTERPTIIHQLARVSHIPGACVFSRGKKPSKTPPCSRFNPRTIIIIIIIITVLTGSFISLF